VNPCDNCANLSSAPYTVRRGGSYNFDDAHMRPSYRYYVQAAFRDIDVGWRCARVP
jgi:formylglycine-generating enzyme required for sulfatase activity